MFLRMPLKCLETFSVNGEDISHAETSVCLNQVMSSDLNVMCPV